MLTNPSGNRIVVTDVSLANNVIYYSIYKDATHYSTGDSDFLRALRTSYYSSGLATRLSVVGSGSVTKKDAVIAAAEDELIAQSSGVGLGTLSRV